MKGDILKKLRYFFGELVQVLCLYLCYHYFSPLGTTHNNSTAPSTGARTRNSTTSPNTSTSPLNTSTIPLNTSTISPHTSTIPSTPAPPPQHHPSNTRTIHPTSGPSLLKP
eukprot:TRINITY_DN2017_c0_g1_i1.p1 TRINITY_DN2017_c0_g1~~TRINITY_DN2017_c0_g1_i1.p1  ORF type:complete len:111 (-),score=29.53 TRINITY_DN2017_c0_g1_i1:268-600(-)